MLRWTGRKITSAHVLALIALFVSLGGSVYAASKINGKRIKVGSEPGNRLKPDTVRGKQVRESSLGVVPTAANAANADNANTVGGASLDSLTIGGTADTSCDPTGSTYVNCGLVSLTLPRSGRVLIVADGTFDGNNSGSGFSGNCRLMADGGQVGTGVTLGSSDGLGVAFNANGGGGFGLNTITGALAAGSHDLNLQCNQAGGSIEYADTAISAVMIGSG